MHIEQHGLLASLSDPHLGKAVGVVGIYLQTKVGGLDVWAKELGHCFR